MAQLPWYHGSRSCLLGEAGEDEGGLAPDAHPTGIVGHVSSQQVGAGPTANSIQGWGNRQLDLALSTSDLLDRIHTISWQTPQTLDIRHLCKIWGMLNPKL